MHHKVLYRLHVNPGIKCSKIIHWLSHWKSIIFLNSKSPDDKVVVLHRRTNLLSFINILIPQSLTDYLEKILFKIVNNIEMFSQNIFVTLGRCFPFCLSLNVKIIKWGTRKHHFRYKRNQSGISIFFVNHRKTGQKTLKVYSVFWNYTDDRKKLQRIQIKIKR